MYNICRPGESWRTRRISWNVHGRTSAAFDCRYDTDGELQQLQIDAINQTEYRPCSHPTENAEHRTRFRRSVVEAVRQVYLALTTMLKNNITRYTYLYFYFLLFPLPVDFAREYLS